MQWVDNEGEQIIANAPPLPPVSKLANSTSLQQEDKQTNMKKRYDQHLSPLPNIVVTWRSRKHSYEQKYYGCCGLSETEAKSTVCCGRAKWKRPESHHPGSLSLPSSRREGGCEAPKGTPTDHLPRPKSPTWSCCNREATAEGCRALNSKGEEQLVGELISTYRFHSYGRTDLTSV
eukprot:TRINITY_DN1531_c0_g1_i2.p2 TRINITY_DN1531_c0_g1~~TRINITY_DN1531_c0_g1_i2.p2  ORF type:complete len:176 (-),score=33.66 TRINITY_DN1531_c0_g1_i2:108-635(-)